MDLTGKKVVLVGGAGLIGSHTADALLREDVREIVIYDNFVRGRVENLASALADPRVRIFDIGGDILQTDILEAALEGADGVFHFAARHHSQKHIYSCHSPLTSCFTRSVRRTKRPRSSSINLLELCERNFSRVLSVMLFDFIR